MSSSTSPTPSLRSRSSGPSSRTSRIPPATVDAVPPPAPTLLTLLPFRIHNPSSGSDHLIATNIHGMISLYEVPSVSSPSLSFPHLSTIDISGIGIIGPSSSSDSSGRTSKRSRNRRKKSRRKRKQILQKKSKCWSCCQIGFGLVCSCHDKLHLLNGYNSGLGTTGTLIRLNCQVFPVRSEIYSICGLGVGEGSNSFLVGCRDGSIRLFEVCQNNTTGRGVTGGSVSVSGSESVSVSGWTLAEYAFVERCRVCVEEEERAPQELVLLNEIGFPLADAAVASDDVRPGTGTAPGLVLSCNGTVVLWEISNSGSSLRRVWTYASEKDVMHLCVVRKLSLVSSDSDEYSAGLVWASLEGGGLVLLAIYRDRIFQLREWGPDVVPDVTALNSDCSGRFVAATVSRASNVARFQANVILYDIASMLYVDEQRREMIPDPLILKRFLLERHGTSGTTGVGLGMAVSFLTESDRIGIAVATSKGAVVGWSWPLDGDASVRQLDPSLRMDVDSGTKSSETPYMTFLRHCGGRIRWIRPSGERCEARCSMIVLSRAEKAELMAEDLGETGEIVTLSTSFEVEVDLIQSLLAGRVCDSLGILSRVRSPELLLDYWHFFSELGLGEEASIFVGLVRRIDDLTTLLGLLNRTLRRFPLDSRARPPFLRALLWAIRSRLPLIEGNSTLLMLLDMKTFAFLKLRESEPLIPCVVTPWTFNELFRRRLALDRASGGANASLVAFDGLSREPVHLEILALRSRVPILAVGSSEIEMPFDENVLRAFVDLVYQGALPLTTPFRTFLEILRNSSLLSSRQQLLLKHQLAGKALGTPSDTLEGELLQHGYLIEDMSFCSLFARPQLPRNRIVRLVQKSSSGHCLVGIQRRLGFAEASSARSATLVQALQETVDSLLKRVLVLEGTNPHPSSLNEDGDDDMHLSDTEDRAGRHKQGSDIEMRSDPDGLPPPAPPLALPVLAQGVDEEDEGEDESFTVGPLDVNASRKRKRAEMETQPLPPRLPPSMVDVPPPKKRKIDKLTEPTQKDESE